MLTNHELFTHIFTYTKIKIPNKEISSEISHQLRQTHLMEQDKGILETVKSQTINTPETKLTRPELSSYPLSETKNNIESPYTFSENPTSTPFLPLSSP